MFLADAHKPHRCSPQGVKPGEGKLVSMGLEKVAAYRSPEGELHQVSAVCPHLGGKILHGPSVNELENKG